MEKTTVFKQNVPLKRVIIPSNPENFRSEKDSFIAESLGFSLTKKSDLHSEERMEEIKLHKKKKMFLPQSEYLEIFLRDFEATPEEFRANTVAVFDFETTGRFNSFAVSMAIELVSIDTGEVLESFYEIINPLMKIEAEAIKVHGISQEKAEEALTFEELYPRIRELLMKADFFVGQNLQFDMAVLERELCRMDIPNEFSTRPIFDTMKAAKGLVPVFNKRGAIKSPTLSESCLHYELIQLDENGNPPVFHDASVDVKYTTKLFIQLMDEVF